MCKVDDVSVCGFIPPSGLHSLLLRAKILIRFAVKISAPASRQDFRSLPFPLAKLDFYCIPYCNTSFDSLFYLIIKCNGKYDESHSLSISPSTWPCSVSSDSRNAPFALSAGRFRCSRAYVTASRFPSAFANILKV